ncbi:transcription factor bHLH49 [Lactuca sativa]|uniref:BHLH domain-containing protein n=1 Tax=Lactuca sativa TaxID=4236 RepID=A0A9R1VX77_LACSA|nr:transcription factor bHLH49 [Lactuca sativa]KAJ0212138.1 hypothetical protein LSAT_V11C400207940 [Lactuca sativa]
MTSYEHAIDEEWVNLSSMFSCDQDSSHFVGHGLFSGEHDQGFDHECPSILWSSANESNSSNSSVLDDQILIYASDHDLKPTFYNYFSQESSNATDSLPYPCQDIFQFETPTNNVYHQSKELCMMEGDSSNYLLLTKVFSDDIMEEILCLTQDENLEKSKMDNSIGQAVPIKRKYEMLELRPNALEDGGDTEKIDNPKKKTRVARDNKNKKNLPSKNQKMMSATNSNEDETEERNLNNEKITNKNNGKGNIDQSFSSSCSEDDSIVSQDLNEGPINLTAKTRAGRGAATDPQSIYARKRRERINERLRILQNIVPNGTKVDISTMLEEAVHYVKFLQLQIKLLSSDDMWMYAPIAYNGMDMGLYQNISPTI